MRLIEQFRVRGPDGQQHTVACYEIEYEHLTSSSPIGVRRYCLNGTEGINRIDDETFVRSNGMLLRREARLEHTP